MINREYIDNNLKKDMVLYAVTDSNLSAGKKLEKEVEKAIRGGATFIQLREKNLDAEDIYEEAVRIKEVCNRYNVPFVINDNVEIAVKSGADGVHLGQNDMEVDKARKILGPDKIIGASAHSVVEAVQAMNAGADYLGAGAVFITGTKKDAGSLPHETFKAICEAVSIPVVAIGGVTYDNVLQLKETGMSGVAVVSAVFGADDVCVATQKLRKRLDDIVK